jgi:hypothetical protein
MLQNSPAAFAYTMLVFGYLFVFMVAAFASGVVVRDDATGFGPMVRSTPSPRSHTSTGGSSEPSPRCLPLS